MTIYIHRRGLDRWCAVRSAHPGGLIVTACGDELDYARVCIATVLPTERACVACGAALGGGQ